MAKSENVTVQIRIADIHEGRFFIQNSTELTVENIRQETAYQIQAEPALVSETEHIAIVFDVKMILKKKPDTVLMHYVANVSFEVGGIELSQNKTEPASIPTEIMYTLVAATYSTVRGLIYARCGGSILRHALLPLQDPSGFLKNQKQVKGLLIPKPSTLTD
ncbi:hypothetical protein KB206_01605 [Microvirga sp. STS02]|uniref:hypothetical protein n=1 Tax=Hymenobacter negativus TaxID=2795026 RepID=UPI0018DC0CC5|nr:MULTISPECIES: hypothetical protein [Bacteria]MBH8567562.1 hypothetical protein [Hymenobacter negativus]MBR7207294.1 hypothetical protein [Microvirga sp. STS02]